MDITELIGTAETSSRIIGLHFQRAKFSCRFGAVFVTLFVCLWFIGRPQYNRLYSAAVCILPGSFSRVCYMFHPALWSSSGRALLQHQNQNTSSRTVTARVVVRCQASTVEVCGG